MRRVDLLPERYVARRRERRNLFVIGMAALVALLLLLGYWFILGTQISSAEDDLAAIQAQNQQLQAQIDELQEFVLLEQEVIAKQTALQTVMAGDIRWPGLLTELAMVIPGEVWLSGLNGSAGQTEGAATVGTETAPVRITSKETFGRIQFQGNALSMPGVARWLIRLGQVDSFAALWLNSATRNEAIPGAPSVTVFDSTLELGEEALSRRFQERDLP